MFKELRWKYEDLRRWLGETAVIADVDTGFTWGEVVGAGIILGTLLLFTVGFVIGFGSGGSGGGGEAAETGGASTETPATDGGSDGDGGDVTVDAGDGGGGGSSNGSTADGGDTTGGDDGTTAVTFNRTAFEDAVHGFVNRERREANATAVAAEVALRTAARNHSDAMAERGEVTHEIPDGVGFEQRYREAGAEMCRVDGNYSGAQNVAKTYFDVRMEGGERFRDEGALAGHVVDAWMDQDGTRENVVSPAFAHEGVGATYVEETGAVYVTQNLC